MRTLLRLSILLVVLCASVYPAAASAPGGASDTTPVAAARRNTSLPLTFEQNKGQAPEQYLYLSHDNGMEAMFRSNAVDLLLPETKDRSHFLELKFGKPSDDARIAPLGPRMGQSNYLLGADSTRWIRRIPNYSRIEYEAIYPGVDLVFYGNRGRLEHDFQIAPDADVSRISFQFKGADRVDLSPSGDLEIHLKRGTIVLDGPKAYQATAAGNEPVSASFAIDNNGDIGFRVGRYDHKRPLVIDPVLTFSTYLAGTGADLVTAVTTDANGNIYVTGSTSSTDFPNTNAEQPHLGGCDQYAGCLNAFITKLDPSGQSLIYSTYLGGSFQDSGVAIAVDKNGDAIVAGSSGSSDFPHAGSLSSPPCSSNDNCYFLSSLKPDGSALIYSGHIAGGPANAGNELVANGDSGIAAKVAVDAAGNTYLTGAVEGSGFQTTPGAYSSIVPGYPYTTMFVIKVDPTGNLIYSTTIPANTTQTNYNTFFPTGIAVDASGQATVAGTAGPGLPSTAGVVQTSFPNSQAIQNPTAGFLLQLNASASALNYATYLPGTDTVGAIAVDAASNTYVTGQTSETALPVSANAYQKTLPAGPNCTCNAGYILKLNNQGTSVLAATYLSGSPGAQNEGTAFTGIALDSKSDVFVGGMTGSPDFPLQDPFVTTLQFSTVASDLVLAGMNPDLSSLLFGSFLSATDGQDPGSTFDGLAIDQGDNLIAVGTTFAPDFPITANSFEPHLPAPANSLVVTQHSFIAKINMAIPAPSVCPDH